MMGKKKGNDPKPWKRRARSILLWLLVLIPVFIFLGVLFLSIFPEQKAGILLSESLSRSLKRPITMTAVSFRPWRGLEVRNLQVSVGTKNDTLSFLQIKKLGAHFRLPSLILGRLDVTTVLIKNPSLRVQSISETEKKVAQTRYYPPKKQIKQKNSKTKLPLSLGFFHLKLNNFSFQFSSGDSTSQTSFLLDGIHLNISELNVPDDPLKSFQDIHGKIHLYSPKGRFFLQSNSVQLAAKTQIDLTLDWQKKAHWTAQLIAGLESIHKKTNQPIQLRSMFHGQGMGDVVHVDTVALSVDSIPLLTIEGEMRQIENRPTFSFHVDGNNLSVEMMMQSAKSLLERPMESFDNFPMKGDIHLLKGKITGHTQSISFDLQTQVEKLNWILEDGSHFLGLSLVNQVQGNYEKGKYFSGQTKGSLHATSFSIFNKDTNWVFNKPEFHWEGQFDQSIVPVRGFISGKSEVGKGRAQIKVDWKSDKKFSWDTCQFSGSASLDSILLGAISSDSTGLDGMVSAQLSFQAPALKRFQFTLKAQMDSLQIPTIQEKLLPFQFSSNGIAATNSVFQTWELKKGDFTLDSLLSGHLHGRFQLSPLQYQVSLSNGQIFNKSVPRFLNAFAPKLTEMKMDGSETLNFELQGTTNKTSGKGSLQFEQGQFHWPRQNLHANDISGYIHFQGSDAGYQGNVTLQVDSTKMESLSPLFLNKNLISCKWDVTDSDSLAIKEFYIALPSFGLEGKGWGNLLARKENTKMSGKIQVSFNPDTQIVLKDSLLLSGKSQLDLTIHQINPNSQHGHLVGLLELKGFQLKKHGHFSIHNLSGKVPFSLEGNLKTKQLKRCPGHKTYTAHDYESQRWLYRKQVPSLGTLSCDSIRVANYTIHATQMDLDLSSGSMDIPHFNCQVFGGNIGGSLRLTLEDEWDNLSYEIRAQAARIQSSEFLSFENEKKSGTELNATISLSGKGIDFDKEVDWNGSFKIVEMEPQLALIILKAMDPNGTDRSILLTRKLISLGWKPRLFSFELHYNFVYSSLDLAQPPYIPITIFKNMSYGRQNLIFIIKRLSKI